MNTKIGRVGRAALAAAALAALPAAAAAELVTVIAAPPVPSLFVAAPRITAAVPVVTFGGPYYGSCSREEETVGAVEATTVEARAQYWAYLMKQPGFSIRSLTRNPGSDI